MASGKKHSFWLDWHWNIFVTKGKICLPKNNFRLTFHAWLVCICHMEDMRGNLCFATMYLTEYNFFPEKKFIEYLLKRGGQLKLNPVMVSAHCFILSILVFYIAIHELRSALTKRPFWIWNVRCVNGKMARKYSLVFNVFSPERGLRE